MKILREYQQKALEDLRALFASGLRSAILFAPTGAGKTVIICELIRLAAARGSRIIFLAHRKELIDQCSARLHDNDVFHGIIKAGVRPMITARVQVASVQTLVRREFEPPEIIIIDECHHANANTYRRILDKCKKSIVIGLTATPCRTDGRGLGELFAGMVTVTTTKTLIDQGFLTPFRVWAPTAIDTSSLRMTAGDYNRHQLDGIVRRQSIYGDIINTWKVHAHDRPTVVFAVSVAHSLELVEAFRAEGVIAHHVDGETPEPDRDRILHGLNDGHIQVVSNCGILTEGWDCPPVACLVVARPTASLSLHLQIVGRGIRTFEGKADCIILDHAGNHIRHGLATDEREWSLAGIRKAKKTDGGKAAPAVRLCPKCYLVNPSTAEQCSGCGWIFPIVRRKPEHKHSDMREITSGGGETVYRTSLDPLTYYVQKMLVGETKGYRVGWANKQFELVFGRRPDFDHERVEIRKVELTWKAA